MHCIASFGRKVQGFCAPEIASQRKSTGSGTQPHVKAHTLDGPTPIRGMALVNFMRCTTGPLKLAALCSSGGKPGVWFGLVWSRLVLSGLGWSCLNWSGLCVRVSVCPMSSGYCVGPCAPSEGVDSAMARYLPGPGPVCRSQAP